MAKGRTDRRRKNKKYICEDTNESRKILFCKWLKYKFNYNLKNLQIMSCEDGGNGIFSKKTILKDDVLISIPEKMMIGLETALKESLLSRSLLNLVGKKSLRENSLTTFQIISLFLIDKSRYLNNKCMLKSNGFEPYLRMLPSTFSHILYWTKDEIKCLPEKEVERVEKTHQIVRNQLKAINQLLGKIKDPQSQFLFEQISWEEYRWAWCCVTTRCVFSGHQKVKLKLKGLRNSNEDDCYLIPFLDLLNHDPTAKVHASFNQSHRSFQIISLERHNKHQQIFIKYGEHSSLDLLLEYGFVPTSINLNDSISFQIEELIEAFRPNNHFCQTKFVKFLSDCKLTNDLTCVLDQGPSWSLLVTILMLISSTNSFQDLYLSICSRKDICDFYEVKSDSIISIIQTQLSMLINNKKDLIKSKLLNSSYLPQTDQIIFIQRYLNLIFSILDKSQKIISSSDTFMNEFFS